VVERGVERGLVADQRVGRGLRAAGVDVPGAVDFGQRTFQRSDWFARIGRVARRKQSQQPGLRPRRTGRGLTVNGSNGRGQALSRGVYRRASPGSPASGNELVSPPSSQASSTDGEGVVTCSGPVSSSSGSGCPNRPSGVDGGHGSGGRGELTPVPPCGSQSRHNPMNLLLTLQYRG
jgi:hypothetical protein